MIILSEYCSKSNVELSFLMMLEEVGLIDFVKEDDRSYISLSQLPDLETYTRMYYDLSINIEGIDAIHQLLERIKAMDEEIRDLRRKLDLFYEDEINY